MPSLNATESRFPDGPSETDIENRLVPKGANVVRHLSLPSEGRDLEWILKEVDTMDIEMGGTTDSWKQGKAFWRCLSYVTRYKCRIEVV